MLDNLELTVLELGRLMSDARNNSIPSKDMRVFMIPIYEAYNVARVISSDEIKSLKAMGVDIHDSIFTHALFGANICIRNYLENRDMSYSDLKDSMRVLKFIHQIEKSVPESYFSDLQKKAFPP